MDFLMGKWPPLKKGGVTVAKEGLKKGGARMEMEMGRVDIWRDCWDRRSR